MHGILHKTLEEYIVDRTDEDAWDAILDRADVEPTLYLQVSHYDDREFDAVLETVAAMAAQDRRAIERDFGRTLAPELCSTFGAHVRPEWGVRDLLVALEDVYEEIGDANERTTLPDVSTEREGDDVVVTYRTLRDGHYCGLAHGVLEGLVAAFDADATVTERTCARDDGNGNWNDDGDVCRFLVSFDD